MNKKNRTEEVLDRIDKYRSMLRHDYSNKEKLSRLLIIKEHYNLLGQDASTEVLKSNFECAEQLAGNMKLPLKVRGVFLFEGRPQKKYYKAEELEESIKNPVNASFPLMLDHKDTEAGKVIGMVDKIKYDKRIKGVRWWGHINDETFARNVVDTAIKEVSVTVYSTPEYDDDYGLIGTDLTFKELSLVMAGAVTGNYIEVDN